MILSYHYVLILHGFTASTFLRFQNPSNWGKALFAEMKHWGFCITEIVAGLQWAKLSTSAILGSWTVGQAEK